MFYDDAVMKASRAEFFLARLFGIRRIAVDIDRMGNTLRLEMRYWRGRYYVIRESYVTQESTKETK